MPGYSGTALVKKLGLKPAMRVALVQFDPGDYERLIVELPPGLQFMPLAPAGLDFIHVFGTSRANLQSGFAAWKNALQPAGMLWISWPKRGGKITTDLNENIIRETGLANGLVDVKVCAVDETWSALKFVYRRKDR